MELCYKEDGVYWFWKFILGDMTYAGYPSPIYFNNLWLEWTQILQEGDHIAIVAPRQHGKTTNWSIIQPLYRTSLFEYYNVLIESASEDQAILILSQIVRIIENNEFLASRKSEKAKWSSTEINYNGGVIRARGVGSEVRGGTYDFICCDDILRSDNKLSDEDIESFIDEELEPMILVRKGQMVIVGTRHSDTDIFSTIESRIEVEEAKWKYFVYDAIIDEEKKEVLCPDRFTFKQLMAKRDIMGRQKFDKEFRGKVYSSGSQLFPYELRKTAMDRGARFTLYPRAKTEDLTNWIYYAGVDTARAGTASADYTVMIVLAYNQKTQEKRIVWIWRKKGLKISEQVNHIAEISKAFNHPIILVEKNNLGQEFIDKMVDEYGLNVESFTTGGKGQAKEDLIRMLIIAFEQEKIIMPMGDEYSREQMKIIDRELDKFVIETTRVGNEVFKGSGRAKDDIIMALSLSARATQSFGYSPFLSSIEAGTKNASSLERYVTSGDFREVLKVGY